MVRSVSEDKLYNTIEFKEFLNMMSKKQEDDFHIEALNRNRKIYIFLIILFVKTNNGEEADQDLT